MRKLLIFLCRISPIASCSGDGGRKSGDVGQFIKEAMNKKARSAKKGPEPN